MTSYVIQGDMHEHNPPEWLLQSFNVTGMNITPLSDRFVSKVWVMILTWCMCEVYMLFICWSAPISLYNCLSFRTFNKLQWGVSENTQCGTGGWKKAQHGEIYLLSPLSTRCFNYNLSETQAFLSWCISRWVFLSNQYYRFFGDNNVYSSSDSLL